MRKPGLNPEDFEQQFPHQEKYQQQDESPLPPWWTLVGHRGAYAEGGHVVHSAMKVIKDK